MPLLFNMLSRLVITFLPRSKCLLISWLQSPFAVILEPPKIKSDTVSTVSPSISIEVMGPEAMIFQTETHLQGAERTRAIGKRPRTAFSREKRTRRTPLEWQLHPRATHKGIDPNWGNYHTHRRKGIPLARTERVAKRLKPPSLLYLTTISSVKIKPPNCPALA